MWSNVFPHDPWQEYTRTTSDSTSTTIKALSLPEGKAAFVQMEAICNQDDTTAYGTFKIAALFKRASGGNLAQEGTTLNIYVQTSSGMTADCSFAADTSNQTVDFNIAGEAATTFNWKIRTRFQIVSQ